MLTGQIKSVNDIPEGDMRRHLPRFQPENFEVNIKLVKELEKIAEKKKCTSAQLALSWLRSLNKKPGMPEVIPIPGSSNVDRIKENAVDVELTDEELREIDTILASSKVIGERYHPAGMKHVNG